MATQKDKIAKFAHLFGTVSDEKIAKMAKVPTAAVMAFRQALERGASIQAVGAEEQSEPTTEAASEVASEAAEPSAPAHDAQPASPPTESTEGVVHRPAVIRLRRRVEIGGHILFASIYENEMVDVVGRLVAPMLEAEPDLIEVLAWQE